MKIALTITGNSSSGGTGIQTDIKTMATHGVYTMSAITALAVQSATGVMGTMKVAPSFLKRHLDDIFTGILPDAIRIGMVSSGGLVKAIEDRLAFYRATNVVVDPMMVSTSDSRLIGGEAVEALKEIPLPMADLLAPNVPKAEVLSGMEIHDPGDMGKAARTIGESYGCAVPLKGGHQLNDTNGLLYRHEKLKWFSGRRVDDPNTHGIGCTLSSAITSDLAKGMDMGLAVERARVYLSGALEAQLDLGRGSGPVDHGFAIRDEC